MRRPPHDRVHHFLDVSRSMAESPDDYDFAGFFLDDTRTEGWEGSTVLTFSELERDDEPIVSDPLVRRFLRHLYGEVPHLLYFLEPDPAFCAVLFTACAYARDDQIVETPDGRISIAMDPELERVLARRLTATALFAAGRGEDWDAVLGEYPVPTAIVDQARADTRRALEATSTR